MRDKEGGGLSRPQFSDKCTGGCGCIHKGEMRVTSRKTCRNLVIIPVSYKYGQGVLKSHKSVPMRAPQICTDRYW